MNMEEKINLDLKIKRERIQPSIKILFFEGI